MWVQLEVAVGGIWDRFWYIFGVKFTLHFFQY